MEDQPKQSTLRRILMSDKAGPQMTNIFSFSCPQIYPGILSLPTHILLTIAWVISHGTDMFMQSALGPWITLRFLFSLLKHT